MNAHLGWTPGLRVNLLRFHSKTPSSGATRRGADVAVNYMAKREPKAASRQEQVSELTRKLLARRDLTGSLGVAARRARLRGPAEDCEKALTDALDAAADYVSTNRAAAEEARSIDEPELADALEQNARDAEPITSEEFHRAAWRLMRVLWRAIVQGNLDDVVWLAKHIDQRKRREWVRRCQRAREGITGVGPVFDEARAVALEDLPHWLEQLDAGGGPVTTEMIVQALESTKTIEGFAARLACDSGAFGYAPSGYHRAKKSFANLD